MRKPRLLDLFCGAGGAAMGYHRAGFEVVGVDIKPQPHYPFEFHQADAMTYPLSGFHVIHASPPCQAYSFGTNYNHKKINRRRENHPNFLPPTLRRLYDFQKPFVVENVYGAKDHFFYALLICGTALGLNVQRHRLFGSNILLMSPGHCHHIIKNVSVRRKRNEYLGEYRTVTTSNGFVVRRPNFCPLDKAKEAMGIDWMSGDELGESIPPAYTEFIGKQLMEYLL